jgi:hypothetical protein
MSAPDKISLKEIIAVIVVLAVLGIAMFLTLGIFASEAQQKEVVVSDAGTKSPDDLEIFVKMLSVDPIKGDATARLEFVPHGKLVSEDGSLSQDLKFFMPSANGKTEVEMKKGKTIPPVEAVFSMYGGNAADYPLDAHKAWFYMYADRVAVAEKKPEKPAPTDEEAEAKPTAHEAEPESDEIPLDVSFFGSIPGYKISVAKDKESDATYVAADIEIARSGTVVAFSFFVGVLMWGLSLAVLFLVMSVILRGRKPEIAMFSFMAALLFAYYAVRNSQPNVPPIGVFSDFMGFFWAEILVGLCLLATVFTWVFRTAKT